MWLRRSFEVDLAEAPTMVALASIRDIAVGEELSVDYSPGHNDARVFAAFMASGARRVQCLCGCDERCRKYTI